MVAFQLIFLQADVYLVLDENRAAICVVYHNVKAAQLAKGNFREHAGRFGVEIANV